VTYLAPETLPLPSNKFSSSHHGERPEASALSGAVGLPQGAANPLERIRYKGRSGPARKRRNAGRPWLKCRRAHDWGFNEASGLEPGACVERTNRGRYREKYGHPEIMADLGEFDY
jgi:hypothetical protein